MKFITPWFFCLILFLAVFADSFEVDALGGEPAEHQTKQISGAKFGAAALETFKQMKGPGDSGGEGVEAPVVQKLEDGRLKIGMVVVDPLKREITFPAKINQRLGLVEYALVTSKGKVHESVLVTQVRPLEIHLAALLVKLAPPKGSAAPVRIAVEVAWEVDSALRREPLERLIVHAKDAGDIRVGSALRQEAWHYVGSSLSAEMLLDEAECGVISLISDGIALIQNPRDGKQDDELHAPNPNLPPGQDFPVVVRLLPFIDAK